MSRSLKEMIRDKQGKRAVGRSEQGTQSTFIIEALLLLTCLMMVIAVSIATIAYSTQANDYYAHKESAIALGTNIAERFAADPGSLAGDYIQGDLMAVCDVDSHRNESGTLYDATISVEWGDREIYQLETSRYVADGEAR